MYTIKSLSLRNVSPFKDVDVDLTKNDGLVIITGSNRDSKVSKQQNNGSGKSMLLNTIANCRYGASPTSESKNSKKDMLMRNDSAIVLRFLNSKGDKIAVRQTAKAWDIKINGEDQQVHRVQNQLLKLQELMPITEQEFYSYTYISSLQTQELHFQNAKPAARLNFITSIFRLDDYDKMKKYFTKQLGLIKEEQIRFDVLQSKYVGLNANLARLQFSEDTVKSHAKISDRIRELQLELDSINPKHSKLLVRRTELAAKQRISDKLHEIAMTLQISDKANLTKLIKQGEAYIRYVDNRSHVEKQRGRLEARLGSIPAVKKTKDEILEQITSLEHALSEGQRARANELTLSKTRKRLESTIADLESQYDGNISKHTAPNKDIDQELAICKTTLELRELLECGSASCPTCKQDVNLKKIKKSVDVAASRIKELRTLKSNHKLYEQITQLRKELRACKGTGSSVEQYDTSLSKIQERLKKAQKSLQYLKEIKQIKKELSDLEEPSAVERPPHKPDYYRQQLDLIRTRDSLIDQLGSDGSEDYDALFSKADTRLKALDAERNAVQKKLTKLLSRKAVLDTEIGEHRVLTMQIKEIEREMDEVKPVLAKRDVFKALEKAWGAKGMKVDVANTIVSTLESNLNKYSNLLFPEPFKFKAYANDKGVFCEVDRGNKTLPTDVRLMSGAESDAFKLLFLLSLLLMIDGERRTNLVILDEPDSHMDDVFRSLFISRFIPFLREIVPHTFVVTPKDYDQFEDAEVWRVVKEKGVSYLEVGL